MNTNDKTQLKQNSSGENYKSRKDNILVQVHIIETKYNRTKPQVIHLCLSVFSYYPLLVHGLVTSGLETHDHNLGSNKIHD